MSRAQYRTERDGRFRHRRLRRRRRHHGARTVAGGLRRAWCWSRGRASPRRTSSTTSSKYWLQQRTANNPDDQPADVPQDRAGQGASACATSRRCLRTHGRRQQRALHRQLLALPRDRLQRAQRARRDRRHGLRRLADQLRGARALLHQGGMGGRRVGPRRREPVRSAALEALSDAAAAGEVVRRAARARRAQARAAPVPGADGDQLACPTTAAPACAHCGFCIGFGCEMPAKSSTCTP